MNHAGLTTHSRQRRWIILASPAKESHSVSSVKLLWKSLILWTNLHVTKWGQGSERNKECFCDTCSQHRVYMADVHPATQCGWLHTWGESAHHGPSSLRHDIITTSGGQFLWAVWNAVNTAGTAGVFKQFCCSKAIPNRCCFCFLNPHSNARVKEWCLRVHFNSCFKYLSLCSLSLVMWVVNFMLIKIEQIDNCVKC